MSARRIRPFGVRQFVEPASWKPQGLERRSRASGKVVYCCVDELKNYWPSSCARSNVCPRHFVIGVAQKPFRNNKRSSAGRTSATLDF
jgi:hypothetical protein